MKEWYKDFLVGFTVVAAIIILVVFFAIKPGLLIWICICAMVYGFLYMCFKIGEKVRESRHYDSFIFYVERLLNKSERRE